MANIRFVCMLLVLGCATLNQAITALAADSNVQVLNFSMDRCEPCKAMQPVLAKLIVEGWQIRQIDIAQEPKLVAQYSLKSAPTLVVLVGGREVDRVVGTIAYSKLLARLEAASGSARQSGASRSPSPQLASSQPAVNPLTAPPTLAERSTSASQLSLDPQLVRGQSPGPADVPDLDVDNQRMLDFVKDLPETPKFATPPANPQSVNAQLASSTSSIGRAAIQSSLPQPPAAMPQFDGQRPNVAPRAAQPQYDPVGRAQQATVRIRIEDDSSLAFGTGTVIYVHEGQALVLTCGHMFRDIGPAAQMSIDVFDKAGRVTNVPAQVVSHSTKQGDIGLMEFRCPYPIVPVPISKIAPAEGDVAFSFGCDRGADPTRRDTQVKHINRYIGPANVEIHGAPVVGRSGGGLFNAQGQLIGVCNAADAEDDEGIYAALPVVEQHVAALRLESLPSDEPQRQVQGQVQLASASISGNSMTPIQTASATSSPTQVRCVIRDAQGKETSIVIDRPSAELVEMLKQSAAR